MTDYNVNTQPMPASEGRGRLGVIVGWTECCSGPVTADDIRLHFEGCPSERRRAVARADSGEGGLRERNTQLDREAADILWKMSHDRERRAALDDVLTSDEWAATGVAIAALASTTERPEPETGEPGPERDPRLTGAQVDAAARVLATAGRDESWTSLAEQAVVAALDAAPARSEPDAWKQACRDIGIVGIYDEFRDAADAIRQLGYYIDDAEKALPHTPTDGWSLADEIRAIRQPTPERGVRDEGCACHLRGYVETWVITAHNWRLSSSLDANADAALCDLLRLLAEAHKTLGRRCGRTTEQPTTPPAQRGTDEEEG